MGGWLFYFCKYVHTPVGHGPWAVPWMQQCKQSGSLLSLQQNRPIYSRKLFCLFKLKTEIKIGPQINQILLSAHSSFGFYLTMTIQYFDTTTCLQPKKMYFFFHVCKEGFEMCILNTAASAFYINMLRFTSLHITFQFEVQTIT